MERRKAEEPRAATMTLLGTGTSSGVPVIGCDCEVCTSSDERNRRLRCSTMVTLPSGKNILIDCGPDFREQALKFEIKELEAVLVTHEHADHIGGIDELRIFNFRSGRSMPIISAKHTIDSIRERFRYCFEPLQKGGGVPQLDLQTIRPFEPVYFDEMEFLPVNYMHGKLEVTGWRIGGECGLAYLTDCNVIPDATRDAVANCEVVVLDALRPKPHPTHFHFDQAIEFANSVSSRETWFIHMTHDIEHAATEAELPDDIRLAYDGLQLTIPGT